MLAKCVLKGGDRGGGGAAGKSRAEEDTKARARDWLAGKRSDLWTKEETRKPKNREDGDREKRDGGEEQRARAQELVREGLLSKACAALISEPPVAVTEGVRDEMRSKHPDPRQIDEARCSKLRVVGSEAAGSFSKDDVDNAMRAFPRGSAGGPSGLRPQHLKDGLVAG